MGSLDRKLRRKRERAEKKHAEKVMKQVGDHVEAMPRVCGECGDNFDKTDRSAMNEWRLAIYDDGRIHMTCPKCGPTPEEIQSGLTSR